MQAMDRLHSATIHGCKACWQHYTGCAGRANSSCRPAFQLSASSMFHLTGRAHAILQTQWGPPYGPLAASCWALKKPPAVWRPQARKCPMLAGLAGILLISCILSKRAPMGSRFKDRDREGGHNGDN